MNPEATADEKTWARERGVHASTGRLTCPHALFRRSRPMEFHSCSPDSYALLDHAVAWVRDGRVVIVLAHSYASLLSIQDLAPAYAAKIGCRVTIGDPADNWYGYGTIPIRYEPLKVRVGG